MKLHPSIISIMLIGLGVTGFVIVTPSLHDKPEINVPLNVLGIKRSPYGEVIAMAMQGPIDSYWGVVEGRKGGVPKDPGYSQLHHLKSRQQPAMYDQHGLNFRLQFFIDDVSKGLEARTNENAASDAHKFYLRSKIEGKLRFAYELDPAHYGNYIAYHFFLTEPQVGTHPALNPHAAKLAHETINYCMNRRVDPREALTAAAAAGNVLELMLNDRFNQANNISRYKPAQMREVLNVMDNAILLYLQLSEEWLEKGLWLNLSEHRISEANDRFHFIKKVRESHETAIKNLENSTQSNDSEE
jgi:hypothetical protein